MTPEPPEPAKPPDPPQPPRPGGASTVDQMSDGSFPASDPPAVWIWDTDPK